MKKLPLYTILTLFACCSVVFGQQEFPKIELIETKDKVLTGSIDKYPITIYLKYHQLSNTHMGIYSLKGWYYYDKIKVKIPLVGIYFNNELTLYHFNDTAKSNELLGFREFKNNYTEELNYYKNLSGFQEKFYFEAGSMFWVNNKQTLPVHMAFKDFGIRKTQEILRLDSNQIFDLSSFGSWVWNFELKTHKDHKYILEYEYSSRSHVMGVCGAGLERGFLFLEFNQNMHLLNFQEYKYQSCNSSISSNEQKHISNTITEYTCTNYQDNTGYILLVDLSSLSISKKPLN